VARVADGYSSDSAFVASLLLAVGLVMTVLSLCLLSRMGQTLEYCAQWVCG
jgi:hypothetical protein